MSAPLLAAAECWTGGGGVMQQHAHTQGVHAFGTFEAFPHALP